MQRRYTSRVAVSYLRRKRFPASLHWKYAEAVPATPEIPEIAEREDAFARMLKGDDPNVSAAQARTALDEANEDRRGGGRGRGLGFAILRAYAPNDGQDFDVLVTDGTRTAAMLAHLSGTQVAVHAEAVVEHVLDRLRGASGSLPNDGNRYENILLYHPLGLL